MCDGVEDPFLRKMGSITYQEIFALLWPLARLLLREASGKS